MWIVYGLSAGIVLGLYDIWTKQAMRANNVIPVVMWSSLFGALFWVPSVATLPWLPAPFHVDVGQTNLPHQLMILPKSLAMTMSWVLAYIAVKALPVSIAGAVRASGPLWTLAGGMVLFGEFLTVLQAIGLTVTIVSYYILSVVGRSEGIVLIRSMPILCMLTATILSAATTVYDKALVALVQLPSIEIQVYSAFQRFLFAFALFIGSWALRGRSAIRLEWHWAIPLVGMSWVVAELIYFVAITDAQALVTMLAVFRRASLVVAFVASALLFKELNLRKKAVMTALLVTGMGILILG